MSSLDLCSCNRQIIVSWVQDERKTVMNLGDKLVRLRGDQGKGFQSSTVGALPRVPDASEGEGSGFCECDREDTLDGLGCLHLLRGLARLRSAEKIAGSCLGFLDR
jgi:hypothetical protein